MKLLIFVIFLIQLHHDRGVETQGASTTSPSSLVVLNKLHQLFTTALSSLVLTAPEAPAGGLASLSSLPASRYILDVSSQPLIRVKIIFLPSETKTCLQPWTLPAHRGWRRIILRKFAMFYPVLSILRPNGKLNFKNLKTENFPPNRPRRIDE